MVTLWISQDSASRFVVDDQAGTSLTPNWLSTAGNKRSKSNDHTGSMDHAVIALMPTRPSWTECHATGGGGESIKAIGWRFKACWYVVRRWARIDSQPGIDRWIRRRPRASHHIDAINDEPVVGNAVPYTTTPARLSSHPRFLLYSDLGPTMLLSLLRGLGQFPSALVSALMLFHIVLPREGLAAVWTEDVLFAGVFLAVARGVTGRGEGVGAVEALSVRARVLVFLGCRLRRCLCVQWRWYFWGWAKVGIPRAWIYAIITVVNYAVVAGRKLVIGPFGVLAWVRNGVYGRRITSTVRVEGPRLV